MRKLRELFSFKRGTHLKLLSLIYYLLVIGNKIGLQQKNLLNITSIGILQNPITQRKLNCFVQLIKCVMCFDLEIYAQRNSFLLILLSFIMIYILLQQQSSLSFRFNLFYRHLSTLLYRLSGDTELLRSVYPESRHKCVYFIKLLFKGSGANENRKKGISCHY